MLRLALVYRHFDLGGSIPRLQVELARFLARRGHEVHVYSIGKTTDRSLAPDCSFHSVPVAAVQAGGRWSARELASFAWNAGRLVEKAAYDCVYSRLPGAPPADILYLGGVAAGESQRAGIGKARRWAAMARHPGETARVALERRAVRGPRVRRFHVDSSQIAADLEAIHGVDLRRISVIPPGVNLDEFRPNPDPQAARRELGLPDGMLVLFCGHYFRLKGLDRALVALARMRARATLVVVGRQDPEPYLRLAAELGVADRVVFAGARGDAWRFFQAADAFVLPSRVEMWGATVVEAMATGVPPIVSGAAGSTEVVEHGRTGYVLSEPFSEDELTATLDLLASSPRLRLEVGGRARVAARFLSWDVVGRRIEAEIVQVARERRATGE